MKFKILFLTILFVGLALYYLVRAGFYPVAIVNYGIISAKDFQRNYQAALVYYETAFKTYAGKDLEERSNRELVLELKRAVLDNLIENALIYKELDKRLGNELSIVIQDILPSFKEASALAVYGLSASDFKELVLEPQARREILENRLKLENGDLDNWLNNRRKSASVILLMFGYIWDGEQVVFGK